VAGRINTLQWTSSGPLFSTTGTLQVFHC